MRVRAHNMQRLTSRKCGERRTAQKRRKHFPGQMISAYALAARGRASQERERIRQDHLPTGEEGVQKSGILRGRAADASAATRSSVYPSGGGGRVFVDGM